jgi:hypothetical protein
MRRRAFLVACGAIACGRSELDMRLSLSPAPNEPYPAPASGTAADLLTPINGDAFEADERVILHAAMPAGAPAVTKIEFYLDSVKVGESTTSPYEYQATGVSSGAHKARAKAIYPDGSAGTSPEASITVRAARTTAVISSNSKVKLWLDPSDAAYRTMASGRVSSCMRSRDTAIFSTDFAQSTPSAQPVLGTIRGKEALFFGTGTSEEMFATMIATISTPYSIFVVVRPVSNNSTGVVVKTTNANSVRISYSGNLGYPRTRKFTATSQLTSSLAAGVSELLEMLVNGTSSETRRNGVTLNGPGANLGTATLSQRIGIGTEGMSVGDIVVISGALTTQERDDISNELLAKYHGAEPTIRHLQLGDSITEGFESTDLRGFRGPLFDLYTSRGKYAGNWIEAVGNQHTHLYSDDGHAGVDGKGFGYWNGQISTLMGQITPDIVDILLGANNMANVAGENWVAGTGPGSTIDSCKQLILTMIGGWPLTRFMVTPILASPVALNQTHKLEFNSNLPAMWDAIEQATGKAMHRWDADTAMGGPSYVSSNFVLDGHPNDGGYLKLAKAKMPTLARVARDIALAR